MPTKLPEPLATPTLAQVLDAHFDGRFDDVHICKWGMVKSYDRTTQTASVQLVARASYTDEEGVRRTERRAPLLGVPVVFPGSGAYSITWELAPGDPVLLVFADHAGSGWLAGGQEDVDDGDDRRNTLTDAVAIPGLRSSRGRISGPPPSDAMVITAGELRLGDKDASKGVAREGDSVDLKTTLGVADLQAMLDARYAVVNPLTNLVGGTIGTISSSSGKVKASD